MGLVARRFRVEVQGVAREIAHHEIEDLVDELVGDVVDLRVLEDQLAVHDQREDLTAC